MFSRKMGKECSSFIHPTGYLKTAQTCVSSGNISRFDIKNYVSFDNSDVISILLQSEVKSNPVQLTGVNSVLCTNCSKTGGTE